MSIGSRRAGLVTAVAVAAGPMGTNPMRQSDHAGESVMADRSEWGRIGADHANRSVEASPSVIATAPATNQNPVRLVMRHGGGMGRRAALLRRARRSARSPRPGSTLASVWQPTGTKQ